eukprot:TRINITY_DN2125_c0_g2_i1.p1 TRINITY_DN2125_c0_g2~~TRINITY_DN2125_c0_g2_i1.p1  ORF type:complete len:226 (+),score=81.87 TRINITY_DN2125_c0_g2_i1:29-679(+)
MDPNSSNRNRLPVENLFVLRCGPKTANILKTKIENNDMDDVSISFPEENDSRHGNIAIEDENYEFVIADLPTHVEAHKTRDNIHYFKTNDLSQMLIIKDNEYLDSDPKDLDVEEPEKIDPELMGLKNEEASEKFAESLVDFNKYLLRDGLSFATVDIVKQIWSQVYFENGEILPYPHLEAMLRALLSDTEKNIMIPLDTDENGEYLHDVIIEVHNP